MNRKTRAMRRHERRRVINRKLRIVKQRAYDDDCSYLVEGTLSKGKVHCSCKYCRYEQYFNIPKAAEASRFKLMELELKEFNR